MAKKKKSTKKKSTKKKKAKKKSTKKKSTKKKSTKKKKAKKKSTKKKKASKKKGTKKKAAKKKSRKKKGTKKKGTKKKSSKKKTAKKPSLAAQLLFGSEPPSGSSATRRTLASVGRAGTVEWIPSADELRAELHRRSRELAAEYDHAQASLEKLIPRIQQGEFGEVTGYYVGFRQKYDRIVSPLKYVIHVCVQGKLSKRALKIRRIHVIPEEVEGAIVKVVEADATIAPEGELTSGSGSLPGTVMPSGKTEQGDLVDVSNGAISISDTDLWGGLPATETNGSNWGTFGVSYRRGRQRFGFVNAHFAPQIGMRMVQPPFRSTGDLTGWEIGVVEKSIQGGTGTGHVDAALINVSLAGNRKSSDKIISFHTEDLLFANRRLDNRDVLQKVFKYGAKTNDRLEGTIIVPRFTGLKINGKPVGEVIKASGNLNASFAMQGDSGSALVAPIIDPNANTESRRVRLLVIGLCFATDKTDKKIAYACHFRDVIDQLSIDLPDHLLRSSWKYR